VRRLAIYALGNLKAEGKPAVAALRRMLRDLDYVAWITRSVKRAASPGVFGGYVLHPVTVALGNIGPAAAEAVPDLLDMLRTGEPFARASAVRALAKIAPGSRHVIAAIEEAFESEDQTVSAAAGTALSEILGAPTVRERLKYGGAVLKTLKEPDLD